MIKKYFVFTIIYLIASIYSYSQIQIGNDIDGLESNDGNGHAVSISYEGNIIAVGEIGGNGIEDIVGRLRVFEWDNSSWNQIGQSLYGDNEYDLFGYSVSLSADGKRVAVGAAQKLSESTGSGYVRIFELINGEWNQRGIDISGINNYDEFGASVALSSNGNRVLISGNQFDGSGTNIGHVKVFEWISNAWVQIGDEIIGENDGDGFGWSTAINEDGSRIAAGTWKNDDNGNQAGLVRIYDFIDNDWVQIGNDLNGATSQERFGYSLSLSSTGDFLAVGTIWGSTSESFLGLVRVYHWEDDSWNQFGNDIFGEAPYDYFGWSVSLSSNANRIVCGTGQNNGNGNDSGHARIYEWNGFDWAQIGFDIDGEAQSDYFGNAVAISGNGDFTAIGASRNDGNGDGSGQTRVFSIPCVSTNSDIITACNDFTWIDGINYTSSNDSATVIFSISEECDSIVYLHLTMNYIDTSVTIDGSTLTSNFESASYQWISCDNNFSIIGGEINQSFTPFESGNYAVIVNEDSCIDTSGCFYIDVVSNIHVLEETSISIYPNPTFDTVFYSGKEFASLEVFDINGRNISKIKTSGLTIDLTNEPKGIYLIKIRYENSFLVEKIIKK